MISTLKKMGEAAAALPPPPSPSGLLLAPAAAGSVLVNLWARLAWGSAGILLCALLVIMTAQMAAAFYTLPRGSRAMYPWDEEITRKFILLIVVVLSVVLDVVLFVSADAMPVNIPLLESGYLFLTLTTLLWLIAAETARIIATVSEHDSRDVPPTLGLLVSQIQWIIRSLKKIDATRWRQTHGTEQPPGRWMDDMTEEEVAKLVAMIEKRKLNEREVARDPKHALDHEKEGKHG